MGKDGFFMTPKGQPIELKLAVPNGWSDWMQAVQMISTDAKAAGINIKPSFPDYNAYQSDRNSGAFDLIIDNSSQISDTPFTYYQYLYTLPILKNQTNFNFPRIQNEKAWALVQKLDSTQEVGRSGHEVDHRATAGHPDAGSVADPALVQRRVGAVQLHDVDELAVGRQRPQLRAGDVDRIPADDGYRYHHAPQAGLGEVNRA